MNSATNFQSFVQHYAKGFKRGRLHPKQLKQAFSILSECFRADSNSTSEGLQNLPQEGDTATPEMIKRFLHQGSQPHICIPLVEWWLKHSAADLITGLKIKKAFLKPAYWELLQQILAFNSTPEITAFLKEVEFLLALRTRLKSRVQRYELQLLRAPIEEIITHLGLAYELKRIEHFSYDPHPSTIEQNLTLTFNDILNEKLRLHQEHNKPLRFQDTEDAFAERLIPALTMAKDAEAQIWYTDIIPAFDDLNEFEVMLDRYCYQNWELSMSDANSGFLKPPNMEEHRQWEINGEKYAKWHNWYNFYPHDAVPKQVDEIYDAPVDIGTKEANFNVLKYLLQWYETFLPDTIVYGNKRSFPVDYCFRILASLSRYCNERFNQRVDELLYEALPQRPSGVKVILATIMRVMDSQHVITGTAMMRGYEEFIEQTMDVTHLEDRAAVKAVFDFLTNDLGAASPAPIDLTEKPFLKLGSYLIWFPGILANKNYTVTLYNRVLQHRDRVSTPDPNNPERTRTSTQRPYNQNENAREMEAFLEGYFKINDYSTASNYDFKDKSGEVDVLAFRDDTLFVIQLKTTYARSSVHEIYNHGNDALLEGARQLDRDLPYIRANFEEFQQLLGFSTPLEQVHLYPLIVATTFEDEGPNQLVADKYKKVSLFELRLILHNRKVWLFNPTMEQLNKEFPNGIPTDFMMLLTGTRVDDETVTRFEAWQRQGEEEIKQQVLKYNLWLPGETLCSAQSLIAAIEENKVWGHLEDDPFLPGMGAIEAGGLALQFIA